MLSFADCSNYLYIYIYIYVRVNSTNGYKCAYLDKSADGRFNL